MNALHPPRSLPALLLAALLVGATAHATPAAGSAERKAKATVDDRGDGSGGGEVGQGTRMGRKPLQPGAYFNDRSREAVVAYYASRDGKACQKGQARRNNGCLPPAGAAKPWQIGEALPAGLTPAAVPQTIAAKLPPVPPGHRYIDAAGDILLIATGSKMVVDGINGLAR